MQASIGRAMLPEAPDAIGETATVGHHRAAIAQRPQWLRRKEAEAADVADGAHRAPAAARADGLRRVFDDRHAERQQGVDLRGAAEEVHRQDGAGARRDRGGDRGGIQVQRDGIDVGEHRPRADAHDGLGGRDEGEGRGHHLVTRPDVDRREGRDQRVGARRHAHDLLRRDVEPRGEGGLERDHLVAEDEAPTLEHTSEGRGERVGDGLVGLAGNRE